MIKMTAFFCLVSLLSVGNPTTSAYRPPNANALVAVPVDPGSVTGPRALGVPPTSSTCATFGPGKDRWPVKTTMLAAVENEQSIAKAPLLQAEDLLVAKNVVADDRSLQDSRMSKDSSDGQLAEVGASTFFEGEPVRIHGYIRRIQCEKDDGDFHIDLSPSAGSSQCVIVEVPSPYTAGLDEFVGPRAAAAREILADLFKANRTSGTKMNAVGATFGGQLFYDAYHGGSGLPAGGGGRGSKLDGQTTCASRLWEVHPAVDVQVDSVSMSVLGAKTAQAYFSFCTPSTPPNHAGPCQADRDPTGVFELTNPMRIQEARDMVAGAGASNHINGIISKSAAAYNKPWHFHLVPDSIAFTAISIEACSLNLDYVEQHLDEVGTGILRDYRWCPWQSRVLREVYPAHE